MKPYLIASVIVLCCLPTLAAPPRGLDLASAVRSGVDLAAPVEIRFEWRTKQRPASAQQLGALLAKHRFQVEMASVTSAAGEPISHTITGLRTGLVKQTDFDALNAELPALTAGPGTVNWTISQSK